MDISISQDKEKDIEDWTENIEYLTFTITLKNKENKPLAGKFWMYVIGENARGSKARERYTVIALKKIPYSLKAYEELEFKTPELKNEYDHYWYYDSGSKYYGVLIAVKDKAGEVLAVGSTRQKLEKLQDAVLKITKKNTKFDD